MGFPGPRLGLELDREDDFPHRTRVDGSKFRVSEEAWEDFLGGQSVLLPSWLALKKEILSLKMLSNQEARFKRTITELDPAITLMEAGLGPFSVLPTSHISNKSLSKPPFSQL